MSLTLLTIGHTLISITAIITGIAVVADLLRGRDSGALATVFLATALLTSATGFLFPFTQFLPSHGTAIVALLVLAVTLPARYRFGMRGAWAAIYAGGAVASLFLLVFVANAQAFAKVPSLRAAAPTQTEPAFLITESITLAIFVLLGLFAVRRFHPAAALATPSVAG
jgi:hypothetical protein